MPVSAASQRTPAGAAQPCTPSSRSAADYESPTAANARAITTQQLMLV